MRTKDHVAVKSYSSFHFNFGSRKRCCKKQPFISFQYRPGMPGNMIIQSLKLPNSVSVLKKNVSKVPITLVKKTDLCFGLRREVSLMCSNKVYDSMGTAR